MKNISKVHCFFEQSGTFKNEFKKLGIQAEDYDIQNNFGETDNIKDLFADIDYEYSLVIAERERERVTVFQNICKDDLILAFYPCIYFCATSQMSFYLGCTNYRKLNDMQKIQEILKRSDKRKEFFDRLIKLVAVCLYYGFRLIIENPYSEQTYLKANFIKAPDLVDWDRTRRGDFYTKPTAYWFFNCEPTTGYSFQKPKEHKTIMSSKGSGQAGLCSEERSLIAPDYARNWICDFVLGQEQNFSQTSFNFE